MSPAGVAIIGCGWAGRRHAEAWLAAGARLAWAVDTDPGRAAAIANLDRRATSSRDLEQALGDPTVSAIDVCLPHHLHADVCLRAITAGKDVLCEKPLAPLLADADRITQAADQAGTLLMVAENEYFDQRYQAIRRLLADGAIGQPALVQATRECYPPDELVGPDRWSLRAEEAGGGIVMFGAIHDFAKLRLMLGEISMVYGVRARQRFRALETEDTVVVTLRFENGTVGTLVISFFMLDPTTAAGDEVHRLRIDGDSGSLEVTGPDRLRLTNADGTQEIAVKGDDTFELEVREFLECMDRRREPATSGRRQRRNLELVHATYASIAAGSPLDV